eukprot:199096_1
MAQQLLEYGDNETPRYEPNENIYPDAISNEPEGPLLEWQDIKINSEIKKRVYNKSHEIKIEPNRDSSEDTVSEEKIEHKYLHTRAKEYLKSSQKDWKLYPAMNDDTPSVIGAAGLTFAFNMYAVPYMIHSAYTYARNKHEDIKLSNKKNHNVIIELFNTTLNKLKQLEDKLIQKKIELTQQEEKMNNFKFNVERNDPWSKVIVCIGPTGYGKSLVCNRLLGNKQSIDELEEFKNALYNVAEDGETESETKELSKHFKQVIIKNSHKSFILSVVDTPGAFDSFNSDVKFGNQMAEYFRASGGVNMFCIFFKFRQKINKNYKDLLQMYTNFWGKDFWKHCVIVITHCDIDSDRLKEKLEDDRKSVTDTINAELAEIAGDLCKNIPIFEFGAKNFKKSRIDLLLKLHTEYKNKYKCDALESPMDKLWKEIQVLDKERN